jgi:hypothetical protein
MAQSPQDAPAAPTAAQAVFYNMTGQDLSMQVNGQMSTIETVAAIPTTTPYTPNHNVNTYTRTTFEPQINQFGPKNTLTFQSLNEGGISVTVEIHVNISNYPVINPLLIMMYSNGAVVTCPTVDSVPYLGHNGETINVAFGSKSHM